jgi:polyisoprenoid-binding protein YceI
MKSFALFALAAILAPAALAQHQTFTINPDASEVKMTLNTTHEVVNGTFHIQSASIEFDRSNPKMSGSVAVVAGSGKTGNESRDKKMNKDILKVDQYRTVSFAPKTYTGTVAATQPFR